jgi:outer membrane protein TolC
MSKAIVTILLMVRVGAGVPAAGETPAPTLEDVIARAIAHSPELRALQAGVAEARASAVLADPFRLSASISAAPGYATGLPTAVLGQLPALASVEAHRLLYDRSARAEQLGAATQIDAAVARLESRKREVGQGAAQLYARVAADAALTASAQRRVTAYETIGTQTDALRREGRARDLDVNRAALQVLTAKRVALQAQTRLDLDRLRLSRLIGEPATVTLTPSEAMWKGLADRDPSPSSSIRMTEEAIANDPELRSFDLRIEALQRAARFEGRLFQPNVAAQMQYARLFDRFRRYYLNFKPDDLSIGAVVMVPVWTGGHRAAASARLAAQLQELIALRDARRTEMEIAVREAEADLTQALAERELAARAHAVAQESLRVAEEMAGQGRGEVSDVPLAQIALADADDDIANANAHLLSARARLLIVRGDLPNR